MNRPGRWIVSIRDIFIMRFFRNSFFLFCLFSIRALSQQISAPEPQAGRVIGTVTDANDDTIPGAKISLVGNGPSGQTAVTNDDGFFQLRDVPSAVSCHVKVSAKGFADWTSPEIVLKPGQEFDLAEIKLTIAVVETTVSAVSQEEMALEQVKAAEKQRVLGIIPNFYIAYDPNTVPMTTKLKYRLAARTAVDVVSISSAAVLAGINQAADRPSYQQGWQGYGQRFGAAYADGATNIMLGGAILPSLLHQDPRYFYQGTGTRASRIKHAMSAPFWCKQDNGTWGFNYSSIGGDLIASSLSNLYYPPKDRGAGSTFTSVATLTGGRIVNALVQEFILSKYTSRAKDKNNSNKKDKDKDKD